MFHRGKIKILWAQLYMHISVPSFGEKKALFDLSRQVPVRYVVKLFSLSLGYILSLNRCRIPHGFLTLLTTPS